MQAKEAKKRGRGQGQRPPIWTVKQIEALKPEAKEYPVKHRDETGLWLIVTPTGTKTWQLFYSFGGKQRKLVIGPVGLAEARAKAAAARVSIAEGLDPAAGKRLLRAAARQTGKGATKPTRAATSAVEASVAPADGVRDRIEDVAVAYLEYAKLNKRSWRGSEYNLSRAIAEWKGRRLSDISAEEAQGFLDGIAQTAPVQANRIHAELHIMAKWAVSPRVKLIAANPFLGVERPLKKEASRERVLSDRELNLVWRAAENLSFPWRQIVKLLVLTGQRRTEVTALSWHELDLDEAVWHLPAARAKNGKAHDVPLSPSAVALLRSVPRFARRPGEPDFVFSASGKAPTAYSEAKLKLDNAIALLNGGKAIQDFRFHDFRRTMATGMARLEIDLHIVERCLNHTGGTFRGVVGVYQRFKFEKQMRHALELWADHVTKLVSEDNETAPSELTDA
jgi:integrase